MGRNPAASEAPNHEVRIASRWQARGWTEEQAYRIAWGYAENVRWERHGIRPGPDCCGETLDPESARQIAEGVYVHDDGE